MGKAAEAVVELVRGGVEPLGYELVGVEYLSGQAGSALLRIYIDHPRGIDVDDCAKVSHQISGLLDVEDPIRENYTLEVSSPGLDRPLFTREHYVRFVGNRVKIRLTAPLEGRSRFTGELLAVEGEVVRIDVDGRSVELPLADIEKARLVPEF